MDITSFDDLLQAARYQPAPQRLLLVFVAVELPEDSTAAQRAAFEAGEGGALVPAMCVDKSPQELDSFQALAQEAAQFGAPWTLLVAAAMSGADMQPPTSEQAGQALQGMVEAVKRGQLDNFIVFDAQGLPLQLQ